MSTHLPYHYAECGLDNIYLLNGVEVVSTPRGEAINIRNRKGLHRAIGLMLVREKKNLNGKEFRFLRHEMNLTQRDLAGILRVNEQSVARWEKARTKIDGPAQGLLRIMYEEYVGGNPKVIKPLQQLAELDEAFCDGCNESFSFVDEGWQLSMAS